jgi:alpha-1,3-rhamnosyl/mannosyltransferase
MRVAFDSSATLFDRGGTQRYVRELLLRRDQFPGIDVEEISMSRRWGWVKFLPHKMRILVHDTAWVRFGMRAAAKAIEADLIHGAAFRAPAHADVPASVTVHDHTPWDPRFGTRWNRAVVARRLQESGPLLVGVLTSCQTTARTIAEHVPELAARIRVTPFGIDPVTFHPASEEELARVKETYVLPDSYVLMVGPHGPRKNFRAMAAALTAVRQHRPELGVVVTGRATESAAGIPVLRVGDVGDDDLRALYSGAELLFYASLLEGFGFPVLEAMACGCPVVTSQDTVLAEIQGGAAMLTDPADIGAMVSACEQVLGDRELRQQMIEAGIKNAERYRWETTVEATARAWGQMV